MKYKFVGTKIFFNYQKWQETEREREVEDEEGEDEEGAKKVEDGKKKILKMIGSGYNLRENKTGI